MCPGYTERKGKEKSTTIDPSAVRTVVWVVFDRVASKFLNEGEDGFVFATLYPRDGCPNVTEYPTEAAAHDAARRAGGDVQVNGLTKWVTPD